MTIQTSAWRRTSALLAAAAVAASLGLPTIASAQALRMGASSVPAGFTNTPKVPLERVQYYMPAPNAPPGTRPIPQRGWRGAGPGPGWRGAGWRGPGYYKRGWGGPGWRGPGYYGPRYYNYNNNGAAVAAGIIGGLALGAAAASAANANQAAGNAQAYCASRYRSYDPRSGTYLGYDGYRHPCP